MDMDFSFLGGSMLRRLESVIKTKLSATVSVR